MKLLQFKQVLLHDYHIPGVGSAVGDGLSVEAAYNYYYNKFNNKMTVLSTCMTFKVHSKRAIVCM